jgi:glycosyltransferase involved in cell wall biosynthesis
MGLYGVAACEAMAAGRVVVSYVGEHVRAHVRSSTGFDLPVIEADTTTLAEVLTSLVEDPESARERAARGVEFVRAMHDGRRSAEVLHPWLTDVSATDP